MTDFFRILQQKPSIRNVQIRMRKLLKYKNEEKTWRFAEKLRKKTI